MNTKQYRAVAGAFLLAFLSCQLGHRYPAWADETPLPPTAQDFPEGSSSVIEALTWRVIASDPAALHAQAKMLVGQIAEVVVVKESESLLVVSLPTQKLSALRQELSKLGSVSPPEAEAAPSAPTTLLRLVFVRS
ncbi:MAG TPA: hypothetical protein VKK81_12690 [Candidatus Binatia bacterium]|nr:hypothetical protein [Candidatus Binatia bacterium]